MIEISTGYDIYKKEVANGIVCPKCLERNMGDGIVCVEILLKDGNCEQRTPRRLRSENK